MTESFDKDYHVTELVINARDDSSKKTFWPNINCQLAKLNRVVISNPMTSVKKDTSFYFCIQVKLDPNSYNSSFVNLGNSALPNFRPVATQFKEFAAQKTEYNWTYGHNVNLYYKIDVAKGDYDIEALMTLIKSQINTSYEKTLGVKSSLGENVILKDKPFNDANDINYLSKFRTYFDYSLVGGKITWKFKLWSQMDATLVGNHPQCRESDTLTYLLEWPDRELYTYINSNLSNHSCYLSGEKWFLDKLGLVEDSTMTPIAPNNIAVRLTTSEQKSLVMETTPIVGYNDIIGYDNKTYVKNEAIQITSPYIYDLRLGNGVYLCLKDFGNTKNMLYDTRGVTHNAVHYFCLRTRKFGSIVEEFPLKWLNIGSNILNNNFEVYFVDEDGEEVDKRDLNFIVSILLYSRSSQLKLQ